MAYYKSIREYIEALEANDKLYRIKRTLNKDAELMPLARWQFRGLEEGQRKVFLFESVTDAKRKKYHGSVLVGAHGATREVYAMAMGCPPEDIRKRWDKACHHPVKPKIVKSGPVQEEIHKGKTLLKHGGVDEFPVPISTPGYDNAPYITGGLWISKDPDSDIANVGIYRGMIKSQTRIGCNAHPPQHLGIHLEKCRKKGMRTMPAAIVLGCTPNLGLVSVAKLPFDTDDIAVAGGISGQPVELIKCQTIDLEVPATSEIVIEGEIPTDVLEREAPFGEYTGYMAMEVMSPIFNVTAITHRKKPILNVFISQFPPSETTNAIGLHAEAALYNFLKHDLDVPSLVDVTMRNEIYPIVVLSMKKGSRRDQIWKALNGANAYDVRYGKVIIAIDEDINSRDPDSVLWALSYAMQPDRDIQICGANKISLGDPSIAPIGTRTGPERHRSSSMLIDATRKWDYAPLSLPKKEFMERARKIWEEEGLPPLTPRAPWYGYPLGKWSEENDAEGDLAAKGKYYEVGKKLVKQRQRLDNKKP